MGWGGGVVVFKVTGMRSSSTEVALTLTGLRHRELLMRRGGRHGS